MLRRPHWSVGHDDLTDLGAFAYFGTIQSEYVVDVLAGEATKNEGRLLVHSEMMVRDIAIGETNTSAAASRLLRSSVGLHR